MRLGLGKNNHLTYASLALNPRNDLSTRQRRLINSTDVKYWGILTLHHTCFKIWTNSFLYAVMRVKTVGRVTNNVNQDQTTFYSFASLSDWKHKGTCNSFLGLYLDRCAFGNSGYWDNAVWSRVALFAVQYTWLSYVDWLTNGIVHILTHLCRMDSSSFTLRPAHF